VSNDIKNLDAAKPIKPEFKVLALAIPARAGTHAKPPSQRLHIVEQAFVALRSLS
jgi:hypothetical protein